MEIANHGLSGTYWTVLGAPVNPVAILSNASCEEVY